MSLAHIVPITATLSGGAYSENVEIPTGGETLRLIVIEPSNDETIWTLRITSPGGRVIKQIKAKGRAYDACEIPFGNGNYTVAFSGTDPTAGTINMELIFGR